MTTKTSDVFVTGMTCGACVRRVQRALEATPGVRQVTIDLTSGRASIEHEEAATQAELVRAVEKSGYQVRETGAGS